MNASVKTYGKVVVNLVIAVGTLLLMVFALPKLLLFFMPFLVGWVIALIASPMVRFLESKLKIKRKAGMVVVIIAVIGLVVFAGYLIITKLVEESIGLINSLPSMWLALKRDFHDINQNLEGLYARFPEEVQESWMGLGKQINNGIADMIGNIGTPTIAAAGNFVKQLPSVIIAIIMGLLSAYSFVAEREFINTWFASHIPESIQKRYFLMKNSLAKAVGGYFKAQLKIEIWIYLLLVIGLSVLNINYSLLIALGIAVLDFFPFFGTGAVLMPWAVVKFLSSDYQMGIGLLIIWGVGQLVRQIIQPKIVGDSIGVPPIPTLFLLYAGYKLAGVIGMILAVPLGIIIYTMYQEGAFDTTINSLRVLTFRINRFRKFTPEELENKDE